MVTDKEFFYSKIDQSIKRYNNRIIGGNIDSGTVTGRELKKNNLLSIDSCIDRIEIDEPSDINEVTLERLLQVCESVLQELEKAKRVLRLTTNPGLVGEVRELISNVEQLRHEIERKVPQKHMMQ